MKFQPNNFDKIIFDMDGVVTSEYIYWDAAALTVYELLYSHKFYGLSEIDHNWCYGNFKELHKIIFCGDKTIKAVKALGVNTNWDLAYIVFCVSKYLEPDLTEFNEWHFESVRMFIENITVQAPEVYNLVGELAAVSLNSEFSDFKRGRSKLWDDVINCFQLWFLGGESVPGLNTMEKPLVDLNDLKKTFLDLKSKGISLGIGTGRPKDEILFPLKKWGLMEFFSDNMIVTYDDVLKAEEDFKPETPLSKPNPFVFLKEAFRNELDDEKLISGNYDKERCLKIAVVGDAPSDLMAAKSAGMVFVGVLTGIDRKSANEYFLSHNADYIFEDVTQLIDD